MGEFRVLVNTDNAAFEDDGASGAHELARILRTVADQLEDGVSKGRVRDVNGNTVGDFGHDID